MAGYCILTVCQSPQAVTPGRRVDDLDGLVQLAVEARVDFPECWRRRKITVEVEAKAKEVAVAKLLMDLQAARKSNATWFVYVLRCADGSLYTGITNDLSRRLEKHNAGKASRYTRSRLPVVLVHQEAQASRSLALKRELAIKALSRRAKESLIQATGRDTRRTEIK